MSAFAVQPHPKAWMHAEKVPYSDWRTIVLLLGNLTIFRIDFMEFYGIIPMDSGLFPGRIR